MVINVLSSSLSMLKLPPVLRIQPPSAFVCCRRRLDLRHADVMACSSPWHWLRRGQVSSKLRPGKLTIKLWIETILGNFYLQIQAPTKHTVTQFCCYSKCSCIFTGNHTRIELRQGHSRLIPIVIFVIKPTWPLEASHGQQADAALHFWTVADVDWRVASAAVAVGWHWNQQQTE